MTKLSPADEAWRLSELPPNLAVLSCTHILDQRAAPTFVDYNGGHLTIFCEKGEDHPDEKQYHMVCLSHFLEGYPELQDLHLVGGYSRAERDTAGKWHTSLQPSWDEEE